MDTYVYVDVLFLINFCMDFLILYSIGAFFKRKSRKLRLVLGAGFSALAYCLTLFTKLGHVSNILAGVAIIAGGVLISFLPLKFREFALLTLAAYVTAFLLGGACMAVYYYITGAKRLPDAFPFIFLAAATAVSYAFIKFISGKIKKSALEKQVFYTLKITLGGANVSVKGLVDTGNSLIEPVSGAPVIISEFTSIKGCLPEKLQMLFSGEEENDLERLLESFTECNMNDRLRMIPYRSVGKKNGMLVGFRPDKVVIMDGASERTAGSVVIGICNGSLSRGDCSFQALINPLAISTDMQG